MTIEHRSIRGVEIRATEVNGSRGVTLQAIKPGVVDDYGTLWNPHAFDDSLEERAPVLCWAHDWSDPLGSGVDHEASDDGPRIRFVYDDFDAVPRARQAWVQTQPKQDGSPPTIQDCSVGFWNAQRRDPTDAEVKQYPGIREVIEKAQLDEVSLVLRGAVPGAKVLAVRGAKVAVDAAVELAARVAAGEITQDEAKAALDLLASADEVEPPVGGGDETTVDHEALDAEIDQVLADRSRP